MTAVGSQQRHLGGRAIDGRRFGYGVAILVNALALYVVTNLLAWDALPFLTDDFVTVLPLIRASLIATMIINAAWVVHDGQVFRSLTQLCASGIALAATMRLLEVFPFEFTDTTVDWVAVAHGVLLVALIGTVIGMVVDAARLLGALARSSGATG
jgi:hypothetical protein